MNQNTQGRYLLLATAFLFSTGGAAIKACQLNSWQVAGFRSGVAALALWLLLPEARKSWTWRMVPVSFTYAATLILFVFATKNTTSANAIFLQATGPLYLLFAAPILLREPARRGDFLMAGWLVFGMSLFYFDSTKVSSLAPHPAFGNALAALSGLTWAGTLLGVRWLSKVQGGNLAPVVLGNAITFLITLPMALPVDRLSMPDTLVILYLGIIQIGLSYVLMSRAVRHVEALAASLILLVEPALNPLWTWVIHHESPSPQAMAGGAIILLGILVHTAWQTPQTSKIS